MRFFVSRNATMDRLIAAQVFVSIAERGSMTATADALDMSRAMVSRYLAHMEHWAGTRLLHRTTRRISLTPAGETALTRCRQLLDIAAQMDVANGPDADTPRGMLRIGCSQSLAQGIVARAIAAYLQRYPQTAVDLQISNRAVNLVEDRLDLAIRITNELPPGLVARRFATCASVVCAAPAYLGRHGVPERAEDLAVHNCLTYSYFGKSLWQFEARQGSSAVSVPVSGNLSANDSMVLLTATIEGAGISLQPLYSAAPFIASGHLRALLPDDKPHDLGVYGIYGSGSRRQHSPLLRTMLDFLATYLHESLPVRG